MNIRQMEFFKRVAELENITKAAKELYTTQPSLSKMIHDLEEELGYLLFHRNGKQILLNENGRIFYDSVSNIFSELAQASTAMKEINHSSETIVKILVRAGSILLPEILNEFYHIYPNSQIRLYQITEDYRSSDFDLILDSMSNQEYEKREAVLDKKRHTLLIQERLLLALPEYHPLQEKDNILVSDLSDYPCALLNRYTSLGKLLHQSIRLSEFHPNVMFESDNPNMIRDFLSLNLAYSFIPEFSWQIEKIAPNLCIREILDFQASRYLYLSFGENRYISKTASDLAEIIKKQFQKTVESI